MSLPPEATGGDNYDILWAGEGGSIDETAPSAQLDPRRTAAAARLAEWRVCFPDGSTPDAQVSGEHQFPGGHVVIQSDRMSAATVEYILGNHGVTYEFDAEDPDASLRVAGKDGMEAVLDPGVYDGFIKILSTAGLVEMRKQRRARR